MQLGISLVFQNMHPSSKIKLHKLWRRNTADARARHDDDDDAHARTHAHTRRTHVRSAPPLCAPAQLFLRSTRAERAEWPEAQYGSPSWETPPCGEASCHSFSS